MKIKNCPNCRKDFSRKPSELKRCRFCSKTCRLEYTRKSRKTECKSCNKIFYPGKRKNRKDPQFCSQACMGESYAFLDYDESMFCEVSDLFDGFMLSDGYVSKKYSHLAWSVKHREFNAYLKEVFSVYLPTSSSRFQKDVRSSNGGYITHRGNTKVHPDLKAQRNRWYPAGIKVVPKDVKITPKSLLMWYLGDGSCRPYSIELCTDNFAKNDVKYLISKLCKIDLLCKMRYHCLKPRIVFNSSESKKFLNFIGNKSPVCCYDYKFNTYAHRNSQ